MPATPFVVPLFDGGVNQAAAPDLIGDNQLTEGLNVHLSDGRRLRKRDGCAQLEGVNSFPGQVTSLVQYRTSAGVERLLATSGTGLYRSNATMTIGAVNFTQVDVTWGLSLPDADRWSWTVMDDVLIGCNGKTSDDNPITLATPTSVGQQMVASSGSVPRPVSGVAWARRFWYINADDEKEVGYSGLGDHTAYDTTAVQSGAGIMVVGDDEDGKCLRLMPWSRNIMLVLKRRSIYMIQLGEPVTDGRQFQIKRLTEKLGTVAPWAAVRVLKDIFVPTDIGVLSVSALLEVGDLRAASVSAAIPQLRQLDESEPDTHAAHADQHSMQALFSIRKRGSTATAGQTDDCWTADYRDGGARPMAWFQHDGLLRARCFADMTIAGRQYTIIGGNDGVYVWDPDTREDDPWTAEYAMSDCRFTTKEFSVNLPLMRKDWHAIAMGFDILDPATDVNGQFVWRMDGDQYRAKSKAVSLSGVSAVGSVLGGGALLGTTLILWGGVIGDTDFYTTLRGGRAGRRSQTIQVEFFGTDNTEHWQVGNLTFLYRLIPGMFGVGEA